MPRPKINSEMPTKKVTVRLFEADINTLRSAYPQRGYNSIIRALARRHCARINEKIDELVPERLSAQDFEISNG